jgi:hypothetical protein
MQGKAYRKTQRKINKNRKKKKKSCDSGTNLSTLPPL